MLRFPRHWTLILLLYVVADFMDPSIPGVFFFDSGVLFIDGVVQVKSDASTSVAMPAPMPFEDRPADYSDRSVVANKLQTGSPPSLRRPALWKKLKHDDSTSFASSSPLEPSPIPHLS